MSYKEWDLQQAAIQQRVSQMLEKYLEEPTRMTKTYLPITKEELYRIIDKAIDNWDSSTAKGMGREIMTEIELLLEKRKK